MGNCTSFDPSQEETAKVVVHDGTMQEFSYPVKVSHLLQRYPSCFVCDADEMGFDEVVTAVHQDEVLKPGQLYFVLPLTQLKRRLPAAEMAALAVKASSALTTPATGDKCVPRRKQVVFFSGEGNGKPRRKVAPESDGGCGVAVVDRSGRGRRRNGNGRGKFTAVLNSIPE